MEIAITKRMDMVESNIEDLFTNLYCKKDFLHLLKSARKAQSDRQPFVLRKLAQMLNIVGQSCEYGRSIEYYAKKVSGVNVPEDAGEINKIWHNYIRRLKSLREVLPYVYK